MSKPAQFDLPQLFDMDLGDGRSLAISISQEGVVMDVWGTYMPGTKAWTNNETGVDASHLGTVDMTFDEWAGWITGAEEGDDE